MEYAPIPTEDQIEAVRRALGSDSLRYSERIEGGLGCTMDVLVEDGGFVVLRRYGPWYAERGEDAGLRETRALELLQRAGIPAPAPIWIDTEGVFDEQTIITSYLTGRPELSPSHPFEWAVNLAEVLSRIHAIRLSTEDEALFPEGAGEDDKRIQDDPELVLRHPLGEELLRRRVQLGGRRISQEHVFSHTDFWPGNTLWDGENLQAVIDWESPATGDREMDVAYCSLDIRYLGMDRVAEHFINSYKEITGETLPNLPHWEAIGLCRPMPDIACWVPAWVSMGRKIGEEQARATHTSVIEAFLERTS